ncbi:hypothetical protein [Rothia sp. P5766]|uniref:hypothetical protein n=1 Tax=Rothia sp. P5766 TaxID=3402656 RepID=UPI003AD820E4
MTNKTITLYTKSTGCQPCNLTKRKFVDAGIATKDENGHLISAIDGVTLKVYDVDKEENRKLAEELAHQGITSVPVVMLNFALEPEDTAPCDYWRDFRPDLIGALANQLTEE